MPSVVIDDDPPIEPLLSVNATAAVLAVSTRHVKRLIVSGELPSLKIGRRRLVRRQDIVAFVEARAARGRP